MNYNNVEVDILVNGSPVVKYHKDGKIFIEARNGSEYEINIKNNNWHRILAVVSVDGLDVLTGKPASKDGGGYVIGGYDSYRIKGYRYDNDNVGAFKFSKKNESYAATKGKKAKRNCGVIGICVYNEKSLMVSNFNYITNNNKYKYNPFKPLRDIWYKSTSDSTPYKVTWIDNTYNDGHSSISSNDNVKSSNINHIVKDGLSDYNNITSVNCCLNNDGINVKKILSSDTFDMGSTWGKNKKSKVTETTFERDVMIFTTEIFYASRQSLIESGVIEDSKPKIAFPQSFPKGFAKPPQGWQG